MSDTKKYFNIQNFDPGTQSVLTDWLQYMENNHPLNENPPGSGFFQNEVMEPNPVFVPASNTRKLGKANAQITFGTDRPSNRGSGKGALGAQGTNTIDIVVGRMAKADGGEGTKDGTLVNNNFFADAARVYISQLTDIDRNFALVKGSGPQLENRSAIGLKADGIRIIGLEGVKIVTGRSRATGFGKTGETNVVGGAVPAAGPIDLIAGNNTDSKTVWGGMFHPNEEIKGLQPLVKGKNMVHAMQELYQIVGEIWSGLFNLTLLQTTYNGVLGVTPIPWHAAAAPAIAQGQMSHVMNSLYHTRVNALMWEIDYLYPFGYKYICSSNVNAN